MPWLVSSTDSQVTSVSFTETPVGMKPVSEVTELASEVVTDIAVSPVLSAFGHILIAVTLTEAAGALVY